MNENDKYIIKEDYHGDVKLIKNSTKKVNLAKPTDILDHKIKPQIMPTVYTNSNPLQNINHSNKKICLTKPKDIVAKDKKSLQAEILFQKTLEEEQTKKYHMTNTKYLLLSILLIIISIAIIYFIIYSTVDSSDAISLFILPIIGICRCIDNSKKK